MKAFLSHSSKDKWYVSQVFQILGETQAEYDEKTFDIELNVQNIRAALNASDIFVLFVSSNSITSSFVNEEQRSALELRGKGILKRCILVAIDDTSYKRLPSWLQEINLLKKITSPKACARRIQAIISQMDAEEDRELDLYIGRDEDDAVIRKQISKPKNETPIILHAVGHIGAGRRTFIKNAMTKFLPRACDTFVEIRVPNLSSADEIYRQIYSLHIVASLEKTIADFSDFSVKSPLEKGYYIGDMLLEMASAGEFLILVDEGGVYTDDGDYQEFFKSALRKLEPVGRPSLGVVQSRMMPVEARQDNKRSFHHFVRDSTKDLLRLLLKAKDFDFKEDQIGAIAGHLDGHPLM